MKHLKYFEMNKKFHVHDIVTILKLEDSSISNKTGIIIRAGEDSCDIQFDHDKDSEYFFLYQNLEKLHQKKLSNTN